MRIKLEVGSSMKDALYGLSANGEQVKRGMDTNQRQLLIENQVYGYEFVSHQLTPRRGSAPSKTLWATIINNNNKLGIT